MITLKELYDMYHPLGETDEDIIQRYFIKNHIEDKGIKLMYELTRKRFLFLNNKIYYGKEYLFYCRVILDGNPKLTEEQRLTLYNCAITFTFYNDLSEKDLYKCKEIFETGNVQSCPMFFVCYLQEKGCSGTIDAKDFADNLKDVISRRDD